MKAILILIALTSVSNVTWAKTLKTVKCKPVSCQTVQPQGSNRAEWLCRLAPKMSYKFEFTDQAAGTSGAAPNSIVKVTHDWGQGGPASTWDYLNLGFDDGSSNIWLPEGSNIRATIPKIASGEKGEALIIQFVNNAITSLAVIKAECSVE